MRARNQEIERLVKEQENSGETAAEFCARRGLNRKHFYVWRQRVHERGEGFARVQCGKKIELELSSGTKVRVAAEDLKVVLEALR